MNAQIIAFPNSPSDEARLAIVAGALQQAIPLSNRDAELQLLIQMGDRLLGQLDDNAAIDSFLARLDMWDAQTR
jgi:hypothetical protein